VAQSQSLLVMGKAVHLAAMYLLRQVLPAPVMHLVVRSQWLAVRAVMQRVGLEDMPKYEEALQLAATVPELVVTLPLLVEMRSLV
jgi:hypothetical protein